MVLSEYRAMKSIPFELVYVRFLNADGNCICPRYWPVIGLVLNVILSVSLINLMRFTHMNILHLRKPKLLQVVLCLLFGVLEPYCVCTDLVFIVVFIFAVIIAVFVFVFFVLCPKNVLPSETVNHKGPKLGRIVITCTATWTIETYSHILVPCFWNLITTLNVVCSIRCHSVPLSYSVQ